MSSMDGTDRVIVWIAALVTSCSASIFGFDYGKSVVQARASVECVKAGGTWFGNICANGKPR